MDATLKGYPISEEVIRAAMSEICAIQLDDETKLGLDHIVPIREDDEYGGYRISIIATYESIITPYLLASAPIQSDVSNVRWISLEIPSGSKNR